MVGQYIDRCTMPDYHRYRLRWGKVRICILENYNSPPTGKAHSPTSIPVTNLELVGATTRLKCILLNSHHFGGNLAVHSPTNPNLPPPLAHTCGSRALHCYRCIKVHSNKWIRQYIELFIHESITSPHISLCCHIGSYNVHRNKWIMQTFIHKLCNSLKNQLHNKCTHNGSW